MKTILKLASIFLLNCFVLACSSDDEPEASVDIDPADANALSSVLIIPSGATRIDGVPPAPSSSSSAPSVINRISNIVSSNGSTAPLNFEYGNVATNVAGCYVQVVGADSYFTIPYNESSGNSGSLLLPLGIPTNVIAGDFEVNFCIYDNEGLVSNVITTSISVLRLGTGSLQVSLSWDDSTDQDLYVTDPLGETISYLNTGSSSGGQLDRDDTSGFGPENIFWTEEAPDGTYMVRVDAFSVRSTPTTYYITISSQNDSRSFTGTTVNGNTVDVVTFTKSGNNLSF